MHASISISELNQLIKSSLEDNLSPTYWVVGELTDFRVARQGHAYFELVEKSGNTILAKIRANLWSFTYREVASRFEKATGTSLKTGMKVLAQVNVNFHPVYGLSANVKDIDASFSLGERARLRQETIDRLTKEGLLNLNASIPLSPVLQKIGIISSPTAAGYGDFVRQIENNSDGFKIYHRLIPATMQGNQASGSVIEALQQFSNLKDHLGLDAVAIIRGGGAQLDLDCFDEYELSKEIATFDIPVLTGIGHERDESVADMVSHTPLKTPTAVAEFILSSFREFEDSLRIVFTQIERISGSVLKVELTDLESKAHRIQSALTNSLSSKKEIIRSIENQLKLQTENKLALQEHLLNELEKSFQKALDHTLEKKNQGLKEIEEKLRILDPKAVFDRGYTRTEKDGLPIAIQDLDVGDEIETISSKNRIASTIKTIKNNE